MRSQGPIVLPARSVRGARHVHGRLLLRDAARVSTVPMWRAAGCGAPVDPTCRRSVEEAPQRMCFALSGPAVFTPWAVRVSESTLRRGTAPRALFDPEVKLTSAEGI